MDQMSGWNAKGVAHSDDEPTENCYQLCSFLQLFRAL